MAKKVRFPLVMPDGAEVRSLEELKVHFDLDTVLTYYRTGELLAWLKDRYYMDEAEKICGLREEEKDFSRLLCVALTVELPEEEVQEIAREEKTQKEDEMVELSEQTKNLEETLPEAVRVEESEMMDSKEVSAEAEESEVRNLEKVSVETGESVSEFEDGVQLSVTNLVGILKQIAEKKNEDTEHLVNSEYAVEKGTDKCKVEIAQRDPEKIIAGCKLPEDYLKALEELEELNLSPEVLESYRTNLIDKFREEQKGIIFNASLDYFGDEITNVVGTSITMVVLLLIGGGVCLWLKKAFSVFEMGIGAIISIIIIVFVLSILMKDESKGGMGTWASIRDLCDKEERRDFKEARTIIREFRKKGIYF